jgi:hypothetical protein
MKAKAMNIFKQTIGYMPTAKATLAQLSNLIG